MAKKTSFYKEVTIFSQADKKPAKVYEVSLHPDLRKEYYDLSDSFRIKNRGKRETLSVGFIHPLY